MGYSNTNSITAQGVAMDFLYYTINTFILMFPQKYFLMEKDVFLAIDNLINDP